MLDQELFTSFLSGDALALQELLRRHSFRLQALPVPSHIPVSRLSQRIFDEMMGFRRTIMPSPDFLHWFFVFAQREIRSIETGDGSFTGLFESQETEFVPANNFGEELSKYLDSMTDDRLEHYRMRFEDGLIFEEMAALLQKGLPAPVAKAPVHSDWLEQWKRFSLMLPEIEHR